MLRQETFRVQSAPSKKRSTARAPPVTVTPLSLAKGFLHHFMKILLTARSRNNRSAISPTSAACVMSLAPHFRCAGVALKLLAGRDRVQFCEPELPDSGDMFQPS